MARNVRNNNAGIKKILERLAEEKKKNVTAVCLVALMAIMWIRVFTQTPEGAEAAPAPTGTEDAPRDEYRVTFVELPRVAGRNDVIVRDFFASNGWQRFVNGQGRKPGGVEEVSIAGNDGNEEVIRRVAEKLNLEATIDGSTPLAFINGQTMKTGEKLSITDGAEAYECEVIEIKEYAVVIRCGEAEIRLSIRP